MDRQIRISQCMIVKDEEKNIERALSWGKGIVQEQIVVDTGSTDRTVEIAERLGAKVFHFQWCDDFSAAKNYALDQASGNWIAFLDADEYITEKDIKKVLPALKEAEEAQDYDLVRMSLVNLDSEGKPGIIIPQDRFFRNDKNIRYRNRIHEALFYKKKGDLRAYDVRKEVMIMHTGYMQDSIQEKNKVERNIRLLEMNLQEEPDEPRLLMYLGDAYLADGDREKAMSYYRVVTGGKAQNRNSDHAYMRSAFKILNVLCDEGNGDDEAEVFQLCNNLEARGWASHPDLDYFRGYWYMKQNNYYRAGVLLESALGKMEHYDKGELRTAGMLEQVLLWIAVANYDEDQNPQKAVQYASTLLRMNKYAEVALLIVLTYFKKEKGEAEQAKGTIGFLQKIYDFGKLKDLVCMYKVAKQAEFRALQNYIYNCLPSEIQEKFKEQQGD